MAKRPLKILGLTQGQNIELLDKLLKAMIREDKLEVEKAAVLVSYAAHFQSSPARDAALPGTEFIKEWEIVEEARNLSPEEVDLQWLRKQLGDGRIWRSFIGDRRFIYGKRSKNFQDYRVEYSNDFFNALAYCFVRTLDRTLTALKPDIVLGFTAVTFGELLALELCRTRGIPAIQLHSSRVGNYFAFHNELTGTSSHIKRLLEAPECISQQSRNLAKQQLDRIVETGLIYEGVNVKIRNGKPFQPLEALRNLPAAMKQEWNKQQNPVTRRDHHDPGSLFPWFYSYIRQPIRARAVTRFLGNNDRTISTEDLAQFGEYAFFPLHSEPEVALQVLAPPYHKNQIELIRNIAMSLPFGMKLVVKEHPRSFGLRPVEYYRSLLQIPNLYFVPMQANSLEVSKHAELVCVISSTIGLEACCIGKPVLLLGHAKFEALPSSMFELCENLFELPTTIERLLANYHYDETKLIEFLAAVIEGSVPIDLYSVLLGKQGRHSEGRSGLSREEKIEEDYRRLAHYTAARIADELGNHAK